jgi:phosphate transport system substrate-binding protein
MTMTSFFIRAAHRSLHLLKGLCLLTLSLLLFGCPASKPTPDNPSGGSSDGGNKIVIRGSNTIGEELAPQLMAEFKKAHPAVTFDLETKATGYGMAALRVGQCDIAAASRAAIQADLDLAKENNIEMNEYVIGAYSVAVVVHTSNPVTNLTKQQVHDIFTGKIQNWSAVGGPDAAIHLYIRDPISGTHLGFKEIAMNNDSYAAHPKMYTNYNAIAQTVAGDALGIGYSRVALTDVPGVKLVSIEGIEPSTVTVNSGRYPYARVLRLYTNKNKESQATKDFIQFILSQRGQEIVAQMGFTPKL